MAGDSVSIERAMTSELPFQIAVVVIFLMSVLVTLYFRIQAAASGEKISRKDEGLLFALILRTLGGGLFLSTFIWVISPQSLEWAAMPMAPEVRWIGAVSGAACSLLMFWTLKSLGRNLTDTVVTRATATLITTGPYRWVRHPFYVTAALLMTSVTILAANFLIGSISFFVLSMLAIRTPKEEQKLIEAFGQSYRDYMTTTGRFFPRLRGRH